MDDVVEEGFTEETVNSLANVLDKLAVKDDMSIDFNIHQSFCLSQSNDEILEADSRNESNMDIEADESKLEPEISASIEGNLVEIKTKLASEFSKIFDSNPEMP